MAGDAIGVTQPAVRARAGSAVDAGLAARGRIRQYELIREIGRGGMGTVYLARDTRLARRVAIKFVTSTSAAVAERFLVEARATARCSHENIVVIYEVDEIEGQPYMVLEYLEGRPLRALLDGTPMPAARAVELVVPVVRALASARAFDLVHRDLKPENIFVTDAGHVKVLDFGLAMLHGDLDEHDGEIVGTMPYMAPEQWGADAIDHRTDLWAVGVVMFEMLAGRHPLEPATLDRLMSAALALDEPMPGLADIDPDLARVVARCLAKRKADRYPDAEALLAALEPHLPRRRSIAGAEINPYPGLTAFREEDADLFHGRRGEVARLVAALGDRPLAGVVGASGAGKSSLVRAGLIPELKRRGRWDAVITRPGRQPLASLAAMAGAALDPQTPGELGEVLRRRARDRGTRLLVFVDQFEELYTLTDDAAVRRTYLACLLGAADDPLSPVRVVVSLRADFLDRVAGDAAFIDALTPGLVVVAAADREDLRAALIEPARYVGYRYESEAIVDDLVAELAPTAGALPLLQFAASCLWDARDPKTHLITRAAYDQIGGVAGALAGHADAVIESMAPAARELARGMFQRLVTPERTRDVVEIDELLEPTGAARKVLDHLVGARLLAIRPPANVELVHESLIDRWPTLAGWLDRSKDDAAFLARLRGAARQWDEAGRSPGLVWRGDAERDARRWSHTYRGELAARERAYLDAVLRLADRAVRTRRFAIAGTIGVLAALVVAASVALVWIRDAETSAVQEAQHARDEAAHARAANEQLEAEKRHQAELVETLQRETAAREAAREAATHATEQVEVGRTALVHANQQLRTALTQAETESQHAIAESDRARVAAEAADEARKAAEEQRVRAEELARKEHERADRRGKISTTLR